jgi:hypothetical protein
MPLEAKFVIVQESCIYSSESYVSEGSLYYLSTMRCQIQCRNRIGRQVVYIYR